MTDRRLYLLSPYRLPTNHQIVLNEQEMASWLHGYLALWHPALLRGAAAPPEVASQYDHETPSRNYLYALPEVPPAFLPDDWGSRVRIAGAVSFPSTSDRAETLARARQSLDEAEWLQDDHVAREMFDRPLSDWRLFFGVGLGYIALQTLYDAMDHEPLLDVEAFWSDVRDAVEAVGRGEGPEQVENHLRAAAIKLREAREQLYYTRIYLLDFALIDEAHLGAPWPAALGEGMSFNVVTTGEMLDRLAEQHPERLQEIRDPLASADREVNARVTLCGGLYREREDALLPIESQLWNLRRGRAIARQHLTTDIDVFTRRSASYHPQIPTLLQQAGMRRAVMWPSERAVMPHHYSVIVSWPGHDGKSIDALTREPLAAEKVATYFNIVYHVYHALTRDNAPTIALMHKGEDAGEFYRDWMALAKLAPVIGEWTSLTRYFADASAGEYTGAAGADDFFNDHLDARVTDRLTDPVSGFAKHARLRRRLDSVWSLAGLYRSLGGDVRGEELNPLADVENTIETSGGKQVPNAFDELETEWAKRLADRLQSRAEENRPGFLLLNPCSFARRLALELPGISGPLPVADPIKAAQFDEDAARLVVEVPAFGFAWIPRQSEGSVSAPRSKIKTADGTTVRNEFFEAEVDPETGGLRGIRDLRTRVNRLGQQLVYNPGSKMRATSVRVTHSGTALGEVVSEGELINDDEHVLCRYRQRFRAWMGRPVLDMHIELMPERFPTGYAWHSYYGSRFAWREAQSALYRGITGTAMFTTHTRPTTPDYLELRLGRFTTALFPGGLPFHQKHGNRMLDVILMPPGEEERIFDLALALDRDNPMQVAYGMVSPPVVVPTEKGPPHIGPSGWLAHLDAPNLLMTTLRPAQGEGHEQSVIAQMLEVSGFGGAAQFRWVRNPVRAVPLEGGVDAGMLHVDGDTVTVEFSGGEMPAVRVDFA